MQIDYVVTEFNLLKINKPNIINYSVIGGTKVKPEKDNPKKKIWGYLLDYKYNMYIVARVENYNKLF